MIMELSRTRIELIHAVKKLPSTLRMLFCLGMARTFGSYKHTIWNGEFDYAVYEWRGERWAFPTEAMGDIDD